MRMKNLLLMIGLITFMFQGLLAQKNDNQNCFERLESAFEERGAYTVADDIHRNVIITFFEDAEAYCIKGKARVENGTVSSIFVYYNDNTSELFEKKFYNQKKQAPVVNNGISEMIYTADGERMRVVFIEKLKPKQKEFKRAVLPDDL